MIRRLLPLLLLFVGCTQATPTAAPTLGGALDVRVAASAAAGAPLDVLVVRQEAQAGLPATLVAVGSYGTRLYHAAFAGGAARFTVPAADTEQSGLVSLTALAGNARGYGQVALTPGAAVEPVVPIVGPRSIIADGAHWSMVVTVPFDRFGNPVAAGTPVHFGVQHPGQALAEETVPVSHGVAWERFYSLSAAGRTQIVAGVGAARGPVSTIDEVPGWPVAYSITAHPLTAPADGRQFITLRTAVIRDRFGNAMVDGTLVTFAVETPSAEPRMIPAYTIDGVAEAQLQAPSEPGTVTVRGTMFGVASEPLQITFTAGPAVNAFSVEASVDRAAGSVRLATSTLLGTLGQFVPDGTLVAFEVRGAAGEPQTVAGEALGGRSAVVLRLAELAPGEYGVVVRVGSGTARTSFRVP